MTLNYNDPQLRVDDPKRKVSLSAPGWYVYPVSFYNDYPDAKKYQIMDWYLVIKNSKVMFGICNHKPWKFYLQSGSRKQDQTGKITPREFINYMKRMSIDIHPVSISTVQREIPAAAWDKLVSYIQQAQNRRFW